MQRPNLMVLMGLAFGLVLPTSVGAQAVVVAEAPQSPAQAAVVTGMSSESSPRGAGLTFFLSDGGTRVIALRDGAVLVDGEQVASYVPGADLDREWRKLVAWTGSLDPDEAVAAVQDWRLEGAFGGEEQAALQAIWGEFNRLSASAAVPAPPAPPTMPDVAIAEEVEAAMALARDEIRRARDELRVSLRDDIRNNVRVQVEPRVHVEHGPRANFVSPLAGIAGGAAGLGGAFLALCAIAFGASFFAGRQIDVMADTVSTSFTRSFFVGLFAQPLILPAFGAIMVGLALTVVGILVIPFAALAFAAALTASVIGGYLSVARVAGSAWMKRRQGDHGRDAAGLLRSIAWGLAFVLAIWFPAVLLQPVPVAGSILQWLAIAVTWGLATTGFGAAILTRGGVRTTFGRKFQPPELPAATLYEDPSMEISTGEWLSGRSR